MYKVTGFILPSGKPITTWPTPTRPEETGQASDNEGEEGGSDSENQDEEEAQCQWLDMDDMDDIGSGASLISAGSSRKRRCTMQITDITGEGHRNDNFKRGAAVELHGKFPLVDPWWQLTVKVSSVGTKVHGIPQYTFRGDWDGSASTLGLFLTKAAGKNRTNVNSFYEITSTPVKSQPNSQIEEFSDDEMFGDISDSDLLQTAIEAEKDFNSTSDVTDAELLETTLRVEAEESFHSDMTDADLLESTLQIEANESFTSISETSPEKQSTWNQSKTKRKRPKKYPAVVASTSSAAASTPSSASCSTDIDRGSTTEEEPNEPPTPREYTRVKRKVCRKSSTRRLVYSSDDDNDIIDDDIIDDDWSPPVVKQTRVQPSNPRVQPSAQPSNPRVQPSAQPSNPTATRQSTRRRKSKELDPDFVYQ